MVILEASGNGLYETCPERAEGPVLSLSWSEIEGLGRRMRTNDPSVLRGPPYPLTGRRLKGDRFDEAAVG